MWSLGGLASTVPYVIFSGFLTYFYIDIMKLPLIYYTIGMVVFSIWNAINDPLFGYYSDKTRTRWGRRVPWIMIFTVPLGIVSWLIWIPPFSEAGLLFAYFLAIIILFDTFYTIVVLNWTALFPEMFQTIEERTKANSLRNIFVMIGTLAGLASAPLIYSTYGWGTLGAVSAILTISTFLLSLVGCQEVYIPKDEAIDFMSGLRYTLINKSFLTFALFSLMAQFTTDMLTAVVPFYNKYVFGWSENELSIILFLTILTTIIVFYPWATLQSRTTPRTAAILSCIWGVFSYTLFLFIYPQWPIVIATLILTGIALGGLIVAPDVLISYVIDEDEIRTGERREGMYFGVHGFVIRLSTILQGIIISAVLGYFGYNPNLEVQPESAILGIRILMGVVPATAMVIGILALYLHPIKGEYFHKLKNLKSG